MAATQCALIDTTLREGEQHGRVGFSTSAKLELAERLAAFGVDFIEVTSPVASPRSFEDCRQLAALDLNSTEVIAHIRCLSEDASIALETGVRHLSLVMAISPRLRAAAHGKSIAEVVDHALGVLRDIRSQAPGLTLRFSTEDTFRAPSSDVLAVYEPIARSGLVDRLGVADTTGSASPRRVAELVQTLSERCQLDLEFHGHDDTGCATANAHAAILAGATHINVSVLGLGERNGITPIESLIARLYADDPEATRARFDLTKLAPMARFVIEHTGLTIPFNHPVVGEFAFTHKAGMHTKAVLNDPGSYEVLMPEDFGRHRHLLVSHKLTGWNVIRSRARDLDLDLPDDLLKELTRRLKALADDQSVSLAELDELLHESARELDVEVTAPRGTASALPARRIRAASD